MATGYQRSSAPRTTAVQQNKLTVNCMVVDDKDIRQQNNNSIWQWNGGMDDHYTEIEEGDILLTKKDYLEDYNTSATMHPDESTLLPVFVSFNGMGDITRGDTVNTAMNVFMHEVKTVGVAPRAYTKNHNGPVTADKRGIVTMVNGPKTGCYGEIAVARVPGPNEQIRDTRPNARKGIVKAVIEPLSKTHMYPLVRDLVAVENGTYATQSKVYDHVEMEYVRALREINDSILTVVYGSLLLAKSDPDLMNALTNVNDSSSKEQFFETLVAGGRGSFRQRFFEVLSDREEFRKLVGLQNMRRSDTAEYLESAAEGPLESMIDPFIHYFKQVNNFRVGTYAITSGPWSPTEVDLKM